MPVIYLPRYRVYYLPRLPGAKDSMLESRLMGWFYELRESREWGRRRWGTAYYPTYIRDFD